jgi:hypothetical protein
MEIDIFIFLVCHTFQLGLDLSADLEWRRQRGWNFSLL